MLIRLNIWAVFWLWQTFKISPVAVPGGQWRI